MLGLSYEYDVNKLWLGGSYGNIEIFTRTDARSNLGGLWCAEDDQFYVGRMVMNVAVDGERLEARTTTFNPVSQMTTYEGHDLSVQKTFFVTCAASSRWCACATSSPGSAPSSSSCRCSTRNLPGPSSVSCPT